MPSKAYGIELGEFIPQPNFRAVRDAKGSWTGSQSYKMLRTSYEGGVAANFQKGVTITSLYPELSAAWDFLQLETWDLANLPGDVVEVTAQFAGFDESEYESDRERTFVLSGTRVERSILQHPLYIKEMQRDDNANHRILVQAMQGLWVLGDPDLQGQYSRNYRDVALIKENHDFTTKDSVIWSQFILEDGNRTYMAPTLQWTLETSNAGGLAGSDIDRLGRVDEPVGNPPTPFNGDFEWLLISLSDTRTKGQSSNSRTWELSPPGGFPKLPAWGGGPGSGRSLYDFENFELEKDW